MARKKTNNHRSKLSAVLGAIIIAFFALNPETLELAFFINAVGFDVYLLLLEIQLLAMGGLFVQYAIRPILNFFLGFSMHSFIMPSWNEIKDSPKRLAHAFPPGMVLMSLFTILLVVGFIGLINGQGFLLIDPL